MTSTVSHLPAEKSGRSSDPLPTIVSSNNDSMRLARLQSIMSAVLLRQVNPRFVSEIYSTLPSAVESMRYDSALSVLHQKYQGNLQLVVLQSEYNVEHDFIKCLEYALSKTEKISLHCITLSGEYKESNVMTLTRRLSRVDSNCPIVVMTIGQSTQYLQTLLSNEKISNDRNCLQGVVVLDGVLDDTTRSTLQELDTLVMFVVTKQETYVNRVDNNDDNDSNTSSTLHVKYLFDNNKGRRRARPVWLTRMTLKFAYASMIVNNNSNDDDKLITTTARSKL